MLAASILPCILALLSLSPFESRQAAGPPPLQPPYLCRSPARPRVRRERKLPMPFPPRPTRESRHISGPNPSKAKCFRVQQGLRETSELHQLKSAPSQLLPVFFRVWPVANLLPLLWTGQYPVLFFKCQLILSSL